jgi:hypothetical protein
MKDIVDWCIKSSKLVVCVTHDECSKHDCNGCEYLKEFELGKEEYNNGVL